MSVARRPEHAYIALGSNLGDRARYLALARERLHALPHTEVVATSSVDETEPLGPPQPRYLNQMVLVTTGLTPQALLAACQAIEREAGRVRKKRWGPRTLDIDIVRYGDLAIAEGNLILPHPELPNRAFWQRELAELEGAER